MLFDLFAELFRPPFVYAFCVDEVSCAASVCDVGGFEFAVLYEFADFLFAYTVGFGYFANGVRFFYWLVGLVFDSVELLLDSVELTVEVLDDVFDGVLFFTH